MTIKNSVLNDDIEEFKKYNLRLDSSMVNFLKKNKKINIDHFLNQEFLYDCFFTKKYDTLEILLKSKLTTEKDLILFFNQYQSQIEKSMEYKAFNKIINLMTYFAITHSYVKFLTMLNKNIFYKMKDKKMFFIDLINQVIIQNGLNKMFHFKLIFKLFSKEMIDFMPVILDKENFGEKIYKYLLSQKKFEKMMEKYWLDKDNWNNFFGITLEQNFYRNPQVIHEKMFKIFWYFYTNIGFKQCNLNMLCFLYDKISKNVHCQHCQDLKNILLQVANIVENHHILQAISSNHPFVKKIKKV